MRRRTKRRRIRAYIDEFGLEEFFQRAAVAYDYPDRDRVWIVHCHNRTEEDMPKPNGVIGLDWKKFTANDVAGCTEFSRREVIKRVRGGKRGRMRSDDSSISGSGDAGDILSELDTDPREEDEVRKTIRNLDQGAIDFIRGVTGASSDAEAVRKAVALAEHMLVQD
jgi:hypothetical protein